MIKHCFAYFNKLGGFYGDPFYVREKDEFDAVLRQSLFVADKQTLEHLKEEELYYLGTFDNESGEIVSSKEFYCVLEPIVSEIIVKRFGKKEGEEDGCDK